MDYLTFADQLALNLENEIQSLPDDFYSSFSYTKTGKNWTHPITWGILTRLLWHLSHVTRVGLDLRLNIAGRVKFQPDLAAWDSHNRLVAFVDYESPNSSDARIPVKDVDSFLDWQRKTGEAVPYVIITTLPNEFAPNWKLRYTNKKSGKSKEGCNAAFKGQNHLIRQNPLQFWLSYYVREFKSRQMQNVAMLNIEGKSVRRIFPETA